MRHRILTQIAVLVAVVSFMAAGLVMLPSADAVTATSPTTSLSAIYTSATPVTYTFSGFTLAGNQLCERCVITFPAGTDLTNITLGSPGGTVTYSGTAATVVFNPLLPKASTVTIVLNGIKNPPTAGTNLTASMVFYTALNKKGPFVAEPALASGPYSIVDPHLAVTFSTTSLLFDLVPEVASPPQNVTIDIDSSHDYTITRELLGAYADINLQVSGDATGTWVAGIRTHTDTYNASASWTTTGGVTYQAGVRYTIMPQ